MSIKRRNFSKEFKTRVVLDALKERETIEKLGKKYELQPSQISKWKAEALLNFSNLFLMEGSKKEQEIDPEKLYAQIGQLKVENDFLKKKLQ